MFEKSFSMKSLRHASISMSLRSMLSMLSTIESIIDGLFILYQYPYQI
ncbi:hypothetical protein CSC03_4829 [Enterobacter hormaechei]|uniref:Uncharacterized protein n=1 Tax=Escherichia coli TaxID=562 RepID=A0A7T7GQE6_ECOLX|nr:hypothetical protein CSC03_4829 [Enterobacter hormaechei]QQM12380.1 hypothetical protein [Escherichia coli]QVQ60235.1 hypothetical protein [Enterobacter cloacae complex sp.]QVQ60275.1 hypothetical protein [Enterobacter cloacae complex sp.]